VAEKKKMSSLEKIGAVAVFMGAATFLMLTSVRLQSCANCAGKGQVSVMEQMPAPCPVCDGTGKLPLLNDWRHSKPSKQVP